MGKQATLKSHKIIIYQSQISPISTNTKATPGTDITAVVKTFDDACQVLGINGEVISASLNDALGTDAASISAYAQLIIIARALNQGWQPDWSNQSEYKYFPWFKNKSGFGLSYYVYAYWLTTTTVGSRLCFKTKKLAEYAATQFADLYNDFLTIK